MRIIEARHLVGNANELKMISRTSNEILQRHQTEEGGIEIPYHHLACQFYYWRRRSSRHQTLTLIISSLIILMKITLSNKTVQQQQQQQ